MDTSDDREISFDEFAFFVLHHVKNAHNAHAHTYAQEAHQRHNTSKSNTPSKPNNCRIYCRKKDVLLSKRQQPPAQSTNIVALPAAHQGPRRRKQETKRSTQFCIVVCCVANENTRKHTPPQRKTE